MARALFVLLPLLLTASLCPAQELAVSKPNEILEEEGKAVLFSLSYSGPRTEVVWKIGEDKLVEVNGNDPPHFYRLGGRASISLVPGDLTIPDLVESDSGGYSGSYLNEGKYHETKFILKVSPSKPVVNSTIIGLKVKLFCNSSSVGVTYEWRNSSGHVLSSKPVYEIDKEKVRTNESLICIVFNKHADINSTLTINLPALPVAGSENSAAYWALLLLLLPVGIVIFCLYKKRKFPFQKTEGERVSDDKSKDPAVEVPLDPASDAAENGKSPEKTEGERVSDDKRKDPADPAEEVPLNPASDTAESRKTPEKTEGE